jgi:hypothetical protein
MKYLKIKAIDRSGTYMMENGLVIKREIDVSEIVEIKINTNRKSLSTLCFKDRSKVYVDKKDLKEVLSASGY